MQNCVDRIVLKLILDTKKIALVLLFAHFEILSGIPNAAFLDKILSGSPGIQMRIFPGHFRVADALNWIFVIGSLNRNVILYDKIYKTIS